MKDIFQLTTSAAWRKLAHQYNPNKQGKQRLWQGGQFHAIGYLSLAPYSTEDGSHHLTEVAKDDPIAACSLSLYRACILLCYRHIINKDYQQAQIDCHQAVLYLYKALKYLRITTKIEHREIASRARCFINSLASQAELQQARLNRKIASHLVFVLGMHRSGTSAITGMLAQAGFGAPADLMPATVSNPKGYWESLRILSLNEDFLAEMESHWSSSLPLPSGWSYSISARKWRSSLIEVISDAFGGGELATIKDPRFCILIPGLEPWLESRLINTSIIIPIRHPLEVSNSLLKSQETCPDKTLQLWIKSIFMAEQATRGHRRKFISFDSLIEDPGQALESCLQLVESDVDDESIGSLVGSSTHNCRPNDLSQATSFIDKSLKRQRAVIINQNHSDVDSNNTDNLIGLAEKVFEAVLANIADDHGISKALDGLKSSIAHELPFALH
jgi:hypothetical protein